MRSVVELITAKRDGEELSKLEIRRLIADYVTDQVPDYQMAALAMAIFYRGLNPRELRTWTEAMVASGRAVELGGLAQGSVDKHSSGGVGDKVSMVLAPAAAACGVTVPMITGRGLSHSGGTIDKLESIPGFRSELPLPRFLEVLRSCGVAIIGETLRMAPADQRLDSLRHVTATGESIPLITASILSKKLLEGAEALVFDVKVGRGAFMKTLESARALAHSMVEVGEALGRRVVAFLTRMEEPLGRMVGNACEVLEAIETLRGRGPQVIEELVVTLGGAMVELAHGTDAEEGRSCIRSSLTSGRALERWEQMVRAQGGELSALPRPRGETAVSAPRDGWVTNVDGAEVGWISVLLGAGRTRRGDPIDPAVGIRIDAGRGAYVARGQALATVLHGARGAPSEELVERLEHAFEIGDAEPPPVGVVLERIG